MKTFFSVALILTLFSTGFSQFVDSFTDLDFTNNPTWSGDNVDWQVTAGGELQLNAPAVSSTKYLSLPSTAIDNGSWEFTSRITVNPSGSNYTDIYLVANTSNLTTSLNGYFVRIGGTDDEVSLFVQTGFTKTKIIDGTNLTISLSSNAVKINVTRTSAGLWKLYSDTTTGYTGYILEGTVTDLTHTQSLFNGVVCKFTSTRSNKFFFDDFTVTGTAAVDNIPPSLDTVIVMSNTALDVKFNEPVDLATSQAITNYTVNNSIGNPVSATRDASDLSLVHLTFGTAFQNGLYNNITVTNITDIANNALVVQGKQFIYYIASVPSYKDVVINELIADPTPTVGLPSAEFIELYNTTTNKIFDLSGWIITDGTSTSTLGNYILLPNQYVILCKNSDLAAFFIYPNKLGVSSISLSNTADELTLKDNLNTNIDYMNYHKSIFDGTGKEGGGWSIELINYNLPCNNASNWKPSININGGTPGSINSVMDTIPDTAPPSIETINVLANNQIEVIFNEAIDTLSVTLANTNITLGRTATLITQIPNNYNSILVDVAAVLDTAVEYQIILTNLADCSGNQTNDSDVFILANIPDSGDLIINEILFNPLAGGYDFVEIYNNSSKYIDIYGWSLSNVNLQGDVINEHKVLYPGEYLVLTENASNIRTEYLTNNPNAFLELADLPTFSNAEGDVYLFYNTTQFSDWFSYHESMHFKLLKDVEGISLERLDFDRKTNDAGNWHSAAENIGFATPGLANSQLTPTQGTGSLSAFPEVFSPDNDGFEDVLNISYKLEEAGYVGNMVVYDSRGRKVKVLVDNELLATEGVFTWDGVDERGLKARIGTYIIYFEVFNGTGVVNKKKVTCVLGHKL